MSGAERAKRKYNKVLGSKEKIKLNIAELKRMFTDKGLGANGLLADLQQGAKNHNFKCQIQSSHGESEKATKSMTTTHNETQYGLISRADIDGKETSASPAKDGISPLNVYFDR
jgi:hypothetical protein